jgi:hypothetical protein
LQVEVGPGLNENVNQNLEGAQMKFQQRLGVIKLNQEKNSDVVQKDKSTLARGCGVP